jgi:Flp pilus assembly protein TadD
MRRTLPIAAVLLALAACAAPEAQRTALPPMLPDKVTPQPYGTLLERARAQAKKATEAFYVDNWSDLDESARGLEQTAQYMAKAEDVPAKHKDTLATASGDLGKLAGLLRKAAADKDVKRTTDVLTKVHQKVREMRLGD